MCVHVCLYILYMYICVFMYWNLYLKSVFSS